MTAPAPSVLSQPVREALDAVTLARSNLADDTEAQAGLLKAIQAEVDEGKVDADSANGLLSAYGAKAFVKVKATKPEETAKPVEHATPAAPAKPAEPGSHNKR